METSSTLIRNPDKIQEGEEYNNLIVRIRMEVKHGTLHSPEPCICMYIWPYGPAHRHVCTTANNHPCMSGLPIDRSIQADHVYCTCYCIFSTLNELSLLPSSKSKRKKRKHFPFSFERKSRDRRRPVRRTN